MVVHDAPGAHDRRPLPRLRQPRQAQDDQVPQERRQPEVDLQSTGLRMLLLRHLQCRTTGIS